MSSSNNGLPAWLVFMIAVALVMGAYYLWLGVQNFLQTGGLGVREATERAAVIVTATARVMPTNQVALGVTLPPTFTPVPECQDFVVTAPIAILRREPNQSAEVITQLREGTVVCVISYEEHGEWGWYLIDNNTRTNRIDVAYMREDLLRALNPTLTPSMTLTPAPTVTDLPSATRTASPEPTLTPTRDPRASDTPTPSPTPTNTPVMQSA